MNIIFPTFKYEYGIKESGLSDSFNVFGKALLECEKVKTVTPFYLDEHGYPDVSKFRNDIINEQQKKNYDSLFYIVYKDELDPDTIRQLQSTGLKVIAFLYDDDWRMDYYLEHIIPYVDYAIGTNNFQGEKICSEKGYNNYYKYSCGAGLYVKKPDNIDYKYDVSFIGMKTFHRQWIVEELEAKDLHVECFGNGWENGRVSLDEVYKIFTTSKINLNLSNSTTFDVRFYLYFIKKLLFKPPIIKNLKKLRWVLKSYSSEKRLEQMKARNFEINASFGFQLAHYAYGLERYFEIGKEVAIFSRIDELEYMIKYYLENEDERQEILNAGYKKVKNFTYSAIFNSFFREHFEQKRN